MEEEFKDEIPEETEEELTEEEMDELEEKLEEEIDELEELEKDDYGLPDEVEEELEEELEEIEEDVLDNTIGEGEQQITQNETGTMGDSDTQIILNRVNKIKKRSELDEIALEFGLEPDEYANIGLLKVALIKKIKS